ncbi:hypothetical protein K8R47_03285, partial [archaeon]|nr:hypothetical protein [archaeon]
NEGLTGIWDCEANCHIEEADFVTDLSNFCRSLGDCGIHYNVEGELTDDGFKGEREEESVGGRAGQPEDPSVSSFSEFSIANEPIDGSLFWLFYVGSYINSIGLTSTSYDSNYNNLMNAAWITLGSSLVGITTIALLSGAGLFSGIGAVFTIGTGGFLSMFPGGVAIFSGLSWVGILASFLVPLAILGAIWIGLNLIFPAEEKEVIYTYTCDSWVAPDGGEDCDKCNDYTTCDEYKCKSLGKACELTDLESPGETQICVWSNPGDTTPPILSPLPIAPTTLNNLEVTPPSPPQIGGYKFKEIISPYTPLEIGVKTNENALCKIGNSPTQTYEEMRITLSGIKLEHEFTIPIRYGENENEDVSISGGGEYTFYVKCKDVNGNTNLNPYSIRFDVEDAPDNTPIEIQDYSIQNGAQFPVGTESTSLTLYLNEPAYPISGGCKYSTTSDTAYEDMQYDLICGTNKIDDLHYGCSGDLDLHSGENTFYFRCQDSSEFKNVNSQAQPSGGFDLEVTDTALAITSSEPNGIIKDPEDIKLEITTSRGAENGIANCYYSLNEEFFSPNYIQFQETDSTTHEHQLPILATDTEYNYYSWCRDIAGNEDTQVINFKVETPDIEIESIYPQNGATLYTNKFDLEIITEGGISEEKLNCYYDNSILPNKEDLGSDRIRHTKENIPISSGTYNYDIRCTDRYKEATEEIEFSVNVESSPIITRVYTQSGDLIIHTNVGSECVYHDSDSNFDFDDPTSAMISSDNLIHEANLGSNNVFYIICKHLQTDRESPVYTIYP